MKRRLGVNCKESIKSRVPAAALVTLPPQSAAAWRHITALLCPCFLQQSHVHCTVSVPTQHLHSPVCNGILMFKYVQSPYMLACSYSLSVSCRLNKLELLHHWGLWTCYTHSLENLSPGSHTALLLPFRSLLSCHHTAVFPTVLKQQTPNLHRMLLVLWFPRTGLLVFVLFSLVLHKHIFLKDMFLPLFMCVCLYVWVWMRVFSGTGLSGDCELPHTVGRKQTSVLCKRSKLSRAGHLCGPSKALSGMWYPIYLPAHLFIICSCR